MSSPSAPRPPSLSRLLLLTALPPGTRREAIDADLHDEFDRLAAERSVSQARSWYRRQARRVVLDYAVPERLRRLFGLRSSRGHRTRTEGRPGGWQNPIDGLVLDLRFATRSLRRSPGFAAAAILMLAIAIGANSAIFSVVDGVLLRPLPFAAPEDVVVLHELVATNEGNFVPYPISPANFIDWQERNRAFSGMSAVVRDAVVFGDGDETNAVQGLRVSGNFFAVLGVEAARGRTFQVSEDLPEERAVVVISDGLWKRAFGEDPGIVGTTVRLSGKPHTVIGIMAPDFAFTRMFGGGVDSLPSDYWVPDLFENIPVTSRETRALSAIARLGPGVTLEQASVEMDAIGADLAAQYPEVNANPVTGAANSVSVENLHLAIVGDARPALWMLMGAVGLVLAIACTNVANLLLVRLESRRQELALRAAIGAGRLHLARQMLTESLLLAGLSGFVGLLLARWALATMLPVAPPAIPAQLMQRVGMDVRVLAFTFVAVLATAVAFGMAPALRPMRGGPGPDLRGVRDSGNGGRRFAGRQLLVATALALALVLLIGMGLLVTTFAHLYAIPLGFDPTNVYVAQVAYPSPAPPGNTDPTLDRMQSFVERLEELPGVEKAGVAHVMPLLFLSLTSDVRVEGRAGRAGQQSDVEPTIGETGVPDWALIRTASPGYLEAMRIPLIRGRAFSWSDDGSAADVAIINQAMADLYWPGQDPIGRRLAPTLPLFHPPESLRYLEVVGIAGDVWERHHWAITDRSEGPDFPPTVYVPIRQVPPIPGRRQWINIVVRHGGDRSPATAFIDDELVALHPGAQVAISQGLDDYVAQQLVSNELRFCALMIGVLSGISLLLASMGVYGVMATHVAGRTYEIGVRRALGAPGGGIVGMIVAQGLRIAVLGVIAGVFIATAATRLLSRWLFEVSPTDPLTFVGLSVLMIGVAVLACWVPARRAASVSPIAALRQE